MQLLRQLQQPHIEGEFKGRGGGGGVSWQKILAHVLKFLNVFPQGLSVQTKIKKHMWDKGCFILRVVSIRVLLFFFFAFVFILLTVFNVNLISERIESYAKSRRDF